MKFADFAVKPLLKDKPVSPSNLISNTCETI